MNTRILSFALSCLLLSSIFPFEDCLAGDSTNSIPLIEFCILKKPDNLENKDEIKYSSLNDLPWVKLSLKRTYEDQFKRSLYLGAGEDEDITKDASLFTLSQSLRLAQTDLIDSNVFNVLNGFIGLFNANAVYTKMKDESTLEPGMALQLVLFDLAVKEKYDVEFGPSYIFSKFDVDSIDPVTSEVTTESKSFHMIQFGITIKVLETPKIGAAASNSVVVPADLSKFYLYLGAGTTVDDWERWNVSCGFGVRLGK